MGFFVNQGRTGRIVEEVAELVSQSSSTSLVSRQKMKQGLQRTVWLPYQSMSAKLVDIAALVVSLAANIKIMSHGHATIRMYQTEQTDQSWHCAQDRAGLVH